MTACDDAFVCGFGKRPCHVRVQAADHVHEVANARGLVALEQNSMLEHPVGKQEVGVVEHHNVNGNCELKPPLPCDGARRSDFVTRAMGQRTRQCLVLSWGAPDPWRANKTTEQSALVAIVRARPRFAAVRSPHQH